MRGADNSQFISGGRAGWLDRGEPDQRLQEVLLRPRPTDQHGSVEPGGVVA